MAGVNSVAADPNMKERRLPIPNAEAERPAREVLTRLGYRALGTSISFVDAPSGETVLKIGVGADGQFLICFQLYDSNGCPAAESEGISPFPHGVKVDSSDGESLLDLPAELDANIRYHLYNRSGDLLTSSDGKRTRIGPCLRMETWPRRGPASYNPYRRRVLTESV
jgi:hypothetical protein